jgi:hypothetical protein
LFLEKIAKVELNFFLLAETRKLRKFGNNHDNKNNNSNKKPTTAMTAMIKTTAIKPSITFAA